MLCLPVGHEIPMRRAWRTLATDGLAHSRAHRPFTQCILAHEPLDINIGESQEQPRQSFHEPRLQIRGAQSPHQDCGWILGFDASLEVRQARVVESGETLGQRLVRNRSQRINGLWQRDR